MYIQSTNTIGNVAFEKHITNIKNKNSYFKIATTNDLYIGNGQTFDHFGEIDIILIGKKQMHPENELTYGDLTSSLVAMYHEIGHARQVKFEFKEKSDLSTVLALNHYARKCSSAYYDTSNFNDGNYPTHTSEIAAQYFGLKMTYGYLTENFDAQTANDLICDYVNNEVGANFIPVDKNNPYTDVYDIFETYNDVFNDVVYKHRNFNTDNQTHVDVYEKFGNRLTTAHLSLPTTTGLQQDAILTNIYSKHSSEKEYFAKFGMDNHIVKALDGIELNKVNNLITGKRHVPAVARINLDTLLPDRSISDDSYGFD